MDDFLNEFERSIMVMNDRNALFNQLTTGYVERFEANGKENARQWLSDSWTWICNNHEHSRMFSLKRDTSMRLGFEKELKQFVDDYETNPLRQNPSTVNRQGSLPTNEPKSVKGTFHRGFLSDWVRKKAEADKRCKKYESIPTCVLEEWRLELERMKYPVTANILSTLRQTAARCDYSKEK